jgi:hypothetical protein
MRFTQGHRPIEGSLRPAGQDVAKNKTEADNEYCLGGNRAHLLFPHGGVQRDPADCGQQRENEEGLPNLTTQGGLPSK